LLWFLAGDDRIRATTRQLLTDPFNQVFVSAASAWEVAIKVSIGKLAVPRDLVSWLPAQLAATRLTPLPITFDHATGVESLPRHHGDPFDRLLIAQALVENLAIVTSDAQFARYSVRLIPC
jgi:PIN domain nuclease of toxin-antitoxin system